MVSTRWDEHYLYIESNGLPAHGMMVGITAWQQQVPLPQPYTGDNAWRLPLAPVPAQVPRVIKDNFLRGAIAIAANGIPIFNPQNNRGEISQMIGELDQWGGHCGRADDYHYHVAPLHLQTVLGPDRPIAYALDGYPLYGLTEPDGSAPAGLDACRGHTTPALGYHYHAATGYPYVQSAFHGEVVEREGQVDPQPRAQGVRPALRVLRGAAITGFTSTPEQNSFRLDYTVNQRPASVTYTTAGAGTWKFHFLDADGTSRDETYRADQRGGGGGNGDRRSNRSAADRTPAKTVPPVADHPPVQTGKFRLRSAVVREGGALPLEHTGDGAGVSPPLEWSGAPAGTASYALIMDHLAPGNEMKCYWTMWDIPAGTTSLPKDVHGIGATGRGFKGEPGYEPPHSQGPGLKHYTIHVYALSAAPALDRPAREVTRERLLAAIKDLILDSAELQVTYTRPDGGDARGEPRSKNHQP